MATAKVLPFTNRLISLPLLATAVLLLLPGCFGITHNPSYVPHLFPDGDIVRTHAKPPGFAYFSDFDPHACRIEVRPTETTNPVQTQQVFIATIYDDKGKPRRQRRVEWLLEGAGQIVEVDESGLFAGRGYKVDNKYAVSYTDYFEHCISRGNGNAEDDFTIRPGQTWCVVTSAVEGDTHLTAYAPEINNWDNHKVVVQAHWIDAAWRLPPPGVGRSGEPHVFTTEIFRHTDLQPLAGYQVRYRILDGPPAGFAPTQTQELVAPSDLRGHANVSLVQTTPQAGVNRIGIEIIRPPDPTTPTGTGIVIARGETRMEWQAPKISMLLNPPPAAGLNQDMTYTLAVTNIGQVPTQEITLKDLPPDGLQYVRSEPPAIVDGNQLVWTLAPLGAGKSYNIQATFRAKAPGQVINAAVLTTRDGLHEERQIATDITIAKLDVQMNAVQTAIVGQAIEYRISVTNTGTGPATNVVITDTFDPGLEHVTKANPLKKVLGTIPAGQTRTETITLSTRQAGKLNNHVEATADNELIAKADSPLNVQNGQLKIDMTGPAKRYVGRPAVWSINIINPGEAVLNNVTVQDLLPPGLAYVSSTTGGTAQGSTVTWTLGTLKPGETKTLDLTTNCTAITPKALNVVVATADPGLKVQAEAPLEISGLPAFRVAVQDTVDPVEVGGKTTYVIDVTNQGTLAGNKVEILAVVPPEMKVTNTGGPVQAKVDGDKVTWPAVDTLPAGQKISYSVECQAVQPGEVRFHVELRTATLQQPVVEEESTNIYDPNSGKRRTSSEPPTTPTAPPIPAATPLPPPAPTATPPVTSAPR